MHPINAQRPPFPSSLPSLPTLVSSVLLCAGPMPKAFTAPGLEENPHHSADDEQSLRAGLGILVSAEPGLVPGVRLTLGLMIAHPLCSLDIFSLTGCPTLSGASRRGRFP